MLTWDETFDDRTTKTIARLMSEKKRVRSGSWSASGAGLCMRRQELQFLGMPVVGSIDAKLQRIFLNGTWMHLRYQGLLLTSGLVDAIEVVHRKPSQRARCSMDGMGTARTTRFSGQQFALELKSRNDFAFNNQVLKGVDEKTRKQVDFEFLLTGLEISVTLNENKNTQEIREWVHVRDPDRVRAMATQVKELNAAIDRQRLHPKLDECRKELKNGEFYKCPFGGPGGACANSGNWPSRVGV
jgi:hypothetical protein